MFDGKKDELISALQLKNRQLAERVGELEDDSGYGIIRKLTDLAKEAKIDVHSQEYQDIMSRVFMDIGGRHSNVLKGYGQIAFIKDNPEEVLQRLDEFTKKASIIRRELQDKRGKK